MLGIGAGGVKCTEVRTSWLSSGHALPCSREVCGQIGFLRGYGVDIDLGLEQASKERSTSSWPARWPRILLQIYPHHQSALRMIPCALEFRNRSRRPAWICKQMHPQLMTLFYNLLFKKSSLKKNKNSIHGVNCTLQIIHIVLLYGTEDLHLTQKYDTIAHFFHKVSFDFLRPRFSIFWGKIHALMEENSRIRLPDRRIQQLHVKIRREYFRCLHQK